LAFLPPGIYSIDGYSMLAVGRFDRRASRRNRTVGLRDTRQERPDARYRQRFDVVHWDV
jgi:hypothetical protein